jgi:hypothetical protein
MGAVTGLAGSVYGAIQEGKQRRRMNRQLDKMSSDNEVMYNTDYLGDYTQRADAQNIIRELRDTMNAQSRNDNNAAVVAGATPESLAAAKENRSKAVASVMGRLGAQGQQFKDRVKENYLNRKSQIEGMRLGQVSDNAASSNNMMYNGIKGIASTDWTSVFGGGQSLPEPAQKMILNTKVSGVAPVKPSVDVPRVDIKKPLL